MRPLDAEPVHPMTSIPLYKDAGKEDLPGRSSTPRYRDALNFSYVSELTKRRGSQFALLNPCRLRASSAGTCEREVHTDQAC